MAWTKVTKAEDTGTGGGWGDMEWGSGPWGGGTGTGTTWTKIDKATDSWTKVTKAS